MNAEGKCRECGTTIPAESRGGFCPQCLLNLGLQEAAPPSESESSAPASSTSPATEKPGDRIGRYRLLQEIGHGGCGVVYMAEQEQPVRRKVALKVIKLGMDTKQVVARFDAERQALALMDHPNIARVLDAGATETGRPYFVMELVGGIKITDYCDQHQLITRQRLDLFIEVCRAIQHAHQKGVIHRDIKPSNILVAEQDGKPVPKVIDFGIAKATQGRLTDQTLFTAFEQFLGTPAYMSPEQTQLGSLDVDTRSDIYSLGVLLYELLTGTTPFNTKELVAAGLDEMRRTIREVEPVKPSTRLTQEIQRLGSARAPCPESDAPSDSHSSNQHSREEQNSREESPPNEVFVEATKTARGARALPKSEKSAVSNRQSAIPTDLDWIVMKCLEKDRARRYETANGLASDIQRHLNNEPVVARPPSKLYEFQKTVRRHKFGFAATAAIMLLLATGAVISTWQASEQSRLRQQAQTAQGNEARERSKAETEAAKSKEVAQFLKEMLKGVGPSKALGRDTAMLKEILDKTAERIGTDLTNQPDVELELRDILAATYSDLGLFEPMQRMAEDSLRLSRARFGEKSAETARALFRLGVAKRQMMHFEQAEAIYREVFDMQKALGASCSRELPETAYELGFALWFQGKAKEAEQIFREGLRLAKREFGSENQQVGRLLRALGFPLHTQEHWTEALASQREALALFKKLFGEEHPEVALTLNDLGLTLSRKGDLEEAELHLRQALAMRRRLLGDYHDMTGDSLLVLSGIKWRQGKLAEAETLMRENYMVKTKAIGWWDLSMLISILQAQGKDKEVLALLPEELPGLRAGPLPREYLARVLAGFAQSLNAEGRFSEAEILAREALGMFETLAPESWRKFDAENILGSSLLGERRFAEAEPLLLSGYQGMRERRQERGLTWVVRIKCALEGLVQLYETTGQPDHAAEWKKKLSEFDRFPANQTNHAAPHSPPKPSL